MRVAILQPSYLPWLGYFDQIASVDRFVLYDDVPFDKNGWRNRNRIKDCSTRGWQWLTVPVRMKSRSGAPICDVEIDQNSNWRRKHLQALRQWYRKAPYLHRHEEFLEEAFGREWKHLSLLSEYIIREMCRSFGIETPIVLSSELNIEGSRSERLVRICEHFGADEYLSGDAARSYLDLRIFSEAGIRVTFQRYAHPEYPQLYPPFVPYLSAVDAQFNCSPEDLEKFVRKSEVRTHA